ncbi:oligosaccharide flippase family protein [Hathewaya histolytica]|uniref:oligosaccharide flippase family protein n=1 Tax=Hathewaya histolytica TaxID=1498 RepID=UPI003B670C49
MSKSIYKNAIFKFLLNIFNLVVPLIIGPYVARTLGPGLLGTINYSQSIFSYFFIFANFGVYQYGLREISRVRNDKEKVSKVFTSLFIFTLVTDIIVAIVYVIFVRNRYLNTEMYYATIMLTFNIVSNIFYVEWVTEALESYNFITIKTIVVKLVYLVLLVLLVRTAKDFNTYIILLLLSSFLNNIFSFIYIKSKIKFNFKDIRIAKHFKPMLLALVYSNGSMLFTQLDRLMLGNYIGKEVVAYYVMAQGIMSIINLLMLSLINVTVPRLSNYLGNNDDEKYISLLNKISKLYFLFLYPASVGMYVISKEIVLIYGGNQFIGAYPILGVFCIYMISLGYEAILSNQVMYIKQKEKEQVSMLFIAGILNLILNFALLSIGKFSGVTSIFTTTIANIVFILFEYIYIKKKLKVNFNMFSFDKLKYLLISLLFIPVTYIIKIFVKGTYKVSAAVIILNSLLYFVMLIITKDSIAFYVLNKFCEKLKISKRFG